MKEKSKVTHLNHHANLIFQSTYTICIQTTRNHTTSLLQNNAILPHLLSAILQRVLERIANDPLCVVLRENLHALDDAGDSLVLQHGVLALGVLPDDDDVEVIVATGDAGIGARVHRVHVEVQVLAQDHVALCCSLASGELDVAFQSDAIAPDGHEGVVEVRIDVLGVWVDLDLFEVHGYVREMEYLWKDGDHTFYKGEKFENSCNGNWSLVSTIIVLKFSVLLFSFFYFIGCVCTRRRRATMHTYSEVLI